MRQFLWVEQFLHAVIVYVAHRYEILFYLMLHHDWHQVGNLSCVSEEHFALAILHIFLNIVWDSFRNTEVFHFFGNLDTHLFRQIEIVIYGMTRRKHHCRIVEQAHFLLPELLRGESLYLYERTEHQFHTEIFGNVVIGWFFAWRLRLGYQYLLYHLSNNLFSNCSLSSSCHRPMLGGALFQACKSTKKSAILGRYAEKMLHNTCKMKVF